MKAFAFAAVLFAGVSVLSSLAFAGESPKCEPLAKVEADLRESIKSGIGKDVEFRDLTVGQFHFATALYALAPDTPAELPVADKATLSIVKGMDAGIAAIIFSDHGKVCVRPIMIKTAIVKLIEQTKTGRDEMIVPPPSGSSKDDGTVTF